MRDEEAQERGRRLLSTTDATVWAAEWLRSVAEYPDIATQRMTMVGWFANAIETGRSAGRTGSHEDAPTVGFMVLTWTAGNGGSRGEWKADWDGLVHSTREAGFEALDGAVASGERARLVELVAFGRPRQAGGVL